MTQYATGCRRRVAVRCHLRSNNNSRVKRAVVHIIFFAQFHSLHMVQRASKSCVLAINVFLGNVVALAFRL